MAGREERRGMSDESRVRPTRPILGKEEPLGQPATYVAGQLYGVTENIGWRGE